MHDFDPSAPRPVSLLWPALLCAGLILATALFAIAGPLTWDSGTYHLMVRGLYETGTLFIPNGHEELASPLLAVGQTMVKHGRIVSQYPEFYTFISLPFYALFGFRGLMVLNALAFAGTCLVIWRMARWFSGHPNAPVAATGVYALGTYAIEFTQSSYPHLTSTFLICAAVWLVWGAALEKGDLPGLLPARLRGPEVRSALAGLIFGIAVGVRLDAIFAGLALAVPFVVFRTLGWRALLANAAGALPALVALAWINAVKFGEWLPFSYGRSGGGGNTDSLVVYLPVALALALAFAVLCWHRVRPIRIGPSRIAICLFGIAVVLLLTPFGHRLLAGLFQIVVDLRLRPDIPEPALSRSPGGAVVYWSNVKKSLLESCPYLIVIALPLIRGVIGGDYGTRWLLWLVPTGFVGFYAFLAWHGSVGWNMRYLNPALPFLAMLASHELLRLASLLPMRRALFWIVGAAIWVVLALTFIASRHDPGRQEMLVLNGGLALAGLLLMLQLAEMVTPPDLTARCRKALAGLLALSLVWASALTFGIDYMVGIGVRMHFLNGSREIARQIDDGALIVTFQPDYVWPLLDDRRGIAIAGEPSGPRDAEAAVNLVKQAIAGRPVYWVTSSHEDPGLAAAFGAAGIAVEPLLAASPGRPFRLFRLARHG